MVHVAHVVGRVHTHTHRRGIGVSYVAELTEPDSDRLSSLLVHLWVLPCRVYVD